MTEPIVPVFISDTHQGSKVGLCPPRVKCNSGDEYIPSLAQRQMWHRAWVPFTERVLSLKRIALILVGDMVELDVKARKHPLVSPSPNDILDLTIDTLAPLIDKAEWMMMAAGTDAHVGTETEYEEALAKRIDSVGSWKGKIQSNQEKSLVMPVIRWESVDTNLRYDIAHHPGFSPGKQQLSQASYPLRIGINVRNSYLAEGKQPPDRVIRAHNHFASEGETLGMKIFTLPPWQWPTGYAHRLGISDLVCRFGGLIGDELYTYPVIKPKQWIKI